MGRGDCDFHRFAGFTLLPTPSSFLYTPTLIRVLHGVTYLVTLFPTAHAGFYTPFTFTRLLQWLHTTLRLHLLPLVTLRCAFTPRCRAHTTGFPYHYVPLLHTRITLPRTRSLLHTPAAHLITVWVTHTRMPPHTGILYVVPRLYLISRIPPRSGSLGRSLHYRLPHTYALHHRLHLGSLYGSFLLAVTLPSFTRDACCACTTAAVTSRFAYTQFGCSLDRRYLDFTLRLRFCRAAYY